MRPLWITRTAHHLAPYGFQGRARSALPQPVRGYLAHSAGYSCFNETCKLIVFMRSYFAQRGALSRPVRAHPAHLNHYFMPQRYLHALLFYIVSKVAHEVRPLSQCAGYLAHCASCSRINAKCSRFFRWSDFRYAHTQCTKRYKKIFSKNFVFFIIKKSYNVFCA